MRVMRDVIIRPVMNGFTVQVGCQTLVYTDIELLANDLIRYQRHPEEIEKAFIDRAINKTLGELVPGRNDGFGVEPAPPAEPVADNTARMRGVHQW